VTAISRETVERPAARELQDQFRLPLHAPALREFHRVRSSLAYPPIAASIYFCVLAYASVIVVALASLPKGGAVSDGR
jgi:hypothetical protein